MSNVFVTFRSFIKVAIRNIVRQRAYALINVLGLAIGIAGSILITLFVTHEINYDTFQEKSDRIVRIVIRGQLSESVISSANTANPTGPILFEEIPEAVNYCRIDNSSNVIVRKGDRTFLENDLYWADSGFFEIFSFPLISGDPSSVLNEPRSMVISEKMAMKYFGDENPVGQVLSVFGDSTIYSITGVMKDFPDNSHLFCDFIVDYRSSQRAARTQWTSNNIHTYLLLDKKMSLSLLNEKIDQISRKYIGPEIKQFLGITLDDWEAAGNYYRVEAQPLLDIHFHYSGNPCDQQAVKLPC